VTDAGESLAAITDASALARAIEAAGERMRQGLAEADRERLARDVCAFVQHERPKVRQAVAEVALEMPDAVYEDAIGVLLQDTNAFVKRAATHSYDERSRRQRVERDQVAHSAGMRRLRGALGGKGKGVLRTADKLCELALGQFVESLEHELAKVTQPLHAAMRSLATDLHAGAVERAQLASRADEANGMLDLLVGIVRVARVHAEVTAPKFRDEPVLPIVESQVALLRTRIGAAREARLRMDVAVDADVTFEVDRAMIAQALGNLLQNAVEAYRADGDGDIVVRVHAERRKGDTLVAVVVEDQGGGIAEARLAHVGEPFVSTKGHGRGLGVANVKNVVEGVHGGTFTLQTVAGGACATMELPRKQPRWGAT
jgi:signal transduction histidine kinase